MLGITLIYFNLVLHNSYPEAQTERGGTSESIRTASVSTVVVDKVSQVSEAEIILRF